MVTPNPFRAFLIISIIVALYVLSVFYRVSNAVIAPNLYRDLGLNEETLGTLGGSFFYSFGLLQIPYLMDAKGYFPIQSGNILILLSIGTIIEASIAGRLFDRTIPPQGGRLVGIKSLLPKSFPSDWRFEDSEHFLV